LALSYFSRRDVNNYALGSHVARVISGVSPPSSCLHVFVHRPGPRKPARCSPCQPCVVPMMEPDTQPRPELGGLEVGRLPYVSQPNSTQGLNSPIWESKVVLRQYSLCTGKLSPKARPTLWSFAREKFLIGQSCLLAQSCGSA
jgi:hypothetical protein